MFDLPVITQTERKKATTFRSDLLDLGFEMSQYSVYFRCCGTREKTLTFLSKIKKLAPDTGKISILEFTDKQFACITNIHNKKIVENEKPEQFLLF